MPHCRPTLGGGAQALAMDVPSGLIRVKTAETLQGFVLVVPGSPEHAHYAGSADEAATHARMLAAELQSSGDDDAVALKPKRKR